MMLIVTGSIAYDQIFNLPKTFTDYILPDKLHRINVSFVTENHQKGFGGTGGNQAYSLALLGVASTLVGSVGKDFSDYREFLIQEGIDVSGVQLFPNEYTAVGFAITDTKDNQIWGFSVGAMKHAKELTIAKLLKEKKLKPSDVTLAVIAPNDHRAIVQYTNECVDKNIPFTFDPAFYIPNLPSATLKKGVSHASIIFGNDYERALLANKIGVETIPLKENQILVTTLGGKGSVIEVRKADRKKRLVISAAKPESVKDPTGAGDAYRGGFIAGYLKGLPLSVCGQMGSTAASFAIEHYGTMNYSFTLDAFKRRYRQNFQTELPWNTT